MNRVAEQSDLAAVRTGNLVKSYPLGNETLSVLRGIDLQVAAGEMVVIMGPSGSGKTTLLNCISAIDVPDDGTVEVAGTSVDYESETARTLLRRNQIGIVFQFFNLIPTLTVRENVSLPFLVCGENEHAHAIDEILDRIGMMHRAEHYPHQLSGGEMQLTSIARALVRGPQLMLADEPTGNVNPTVGRAIMAILRATAREKNAGILMVTHNPENAAWADRICFLKDGVIADELMQNSQADSVAPIYDRLLELDI